jgi:hypothetical protein
MTGPRTTRTLPLLLAAAAAACASGPAAAPPAADAVRAVAGDAGPTLDGDPGDPCWAAAPEARVALSGTSGPASCRVRAVVAAGALHLLVRWEDGTEDREHKPWVRAGDGWEEGPEREDVLSVAFPVAGEFTADMLSPRDATWDVWHWKSCRTDPAGFAMDKSHVMSLADPGGKRAEHRIPGGGAIFMVRPEDAGTSATETLGKPSDGERGPKYRARRPDGSAGDVAARGAWKDGWWTVELSRALATGHADDRDLAGLASIPVAFAIHDRSENEAHTASGPLLLLLPGAE